MGIFKRKKKTADPVSGFKVVHDMRLPLVPFGSNIMKSDVVMICVDRIIYFYVGNLKKVKRKIHKSR